MNYIEEINSFHRWLETHHLSSTAQLLWFKFMNLFNRCGWEEWVSVDNLTLRLLSCSGCEKSALKARNELVKAGLVTHIKGKRGCPSKYKMISFTVNFTVNTTVNSTVKETVNSTVHSTDINKHKHKQKQKRSLSHLSYSLPLQVESTREEFSSGRDEIEQRFGEKIKPLTEQDRKQLAELKELYPSTQILSAIERASGTGYSVGYIRAILANSKFSESEARKVVESMKTSNGQGASYDIEEYESFSIFDEVASND